MRMSLVAGLALLLGNGLMAQEPAGTESESQTATGTLTVTVNDEGNDEKASSPVETKVTSSFQILMVDDQGNVVSKKITSEGDESSGAGKDVVKEAVAEGKSFEFKMDGHHKIAIVTQDGKTKTLDLSKIGPDANNVIEVRVVGKSSDGEGEEGAIRVELHGAEIAEQVRESLQGLDLSGTDIKVDEIAEHIRAAMGDVAKVQKGTKLMKIGRAIMLDGKPLRGAVDVAEEDSKSATVVVEGVQRSDSSEIGSKLDAIMKRLDQIESELNELKKSKE